MRLFSLALIVSLAGCGTATPPVDAARGDAGTDGGHDAGTDGGHDAGDDGGSDAGADADDDSSVFDGLDAFVPSDAGSLDSGIARIADPPTHPSASPIAPFTTCTVQTFTDTYITADHRQPPQVIPYPNIPPSAGPHYCYWADFQTYDAPVPWPYLVHDLEHGAVILAYRCENDADCDPVRAEFDAIVAAEGVDPVCRMETSSTRFIIVPAPDLPVPIAAIAWTHVYEATCLDSASLRAFVTAHYGMGSESLCASGAYGTDAGPCPF
jgi:hypothetical protein